MPTVCPSNERRGRAVLVEGIWGKKWSTEDCQWIRVWTGVGIMVFNGLEGFHMRQWLINE